MITITINNSYSKIEGTTIEIDSKLRTLLSYEPSSTQYWKVSNPKLIWAATRKHLYSLKTHLFPTGLLPLVLDALRSMAVPFCEIDKRCRPEQSHYWSWISKQPELYDSQKEAIKIFLEKHRGTIVSATGTGKTLILQHIIKEVGVSALIIVPSLNIMNQIYKDFKLSFGPKHVAIIKQYHEGAKIKPIMIANIQSLINKPKEFFKNFDMLIVDEAHHSSSKTTTYLNKNMFTHIYYRAYLTATAYRNDGADLELIGVIGDVIYKYESQNAIRDGKIVPPHFFIHTITNQDKSFSDYFDEYSECIVHNKERNEIIKENALSMSDKEHQVLIMVEQIEHGSILHGMIPGSVYINGGMLDTDNQRLLMAFNNHKFNILIATSVCGEGVNLPSAHVLINAAGGKAKSEVIQRVGRVLRVVSGKTKAIVIDFLDTKTRWLGKHSKKRISYYKTYDTPIKMM